MRLHYCVFNLVNILYFLPVLTLKSFRSLWREILRDYMEGVGFAKGDWVLALTDQQTLWDAISQWYETTNIKMHTCKMTKSLRLSISSSQKIAEKVHSCVISSYNCSWFLIITEALRHSRPRVLACLILSFACSPHFFHHIFTFAEFVEILQSQHSCWARHFASMSGYHNISMTWLQD